MTPRSPASSILSSRVIGGPAYSHVAPKYAGPVSAWKLGDSSHSGHRKLAGTRALPQPFSPKLSPRSRGERADPVLQKERDAEAAVALPARTSWASAKGTSPAGSTNENELGSPATGALRQWIAELDAERDTFPSLALYCEHKLRAVFANAVRHEPDSTRTAQVCILHYRVLKTLGRYSAVLGALHQEMLKAIYHKPQDSEWSAIHGDRCAELTPFFMQTQKFEDDNHRLRRELDRYSDVATLLEEEKARRDVAITFTAKRAKFQSLGHWLVRWKFAMEVGPPLHCDVSMP
jgi:hypothetical protein